jgi:Na+/H+ antiporter NhaD/arsenite permease-like protein
VPVEFWLFGLTLLGVATLPRYPLRVAAAGLAAICLYKLGFDGFETLPGWHGLLAHMDGQFSGLINLLLLLLGFTVLSDQFEQSKIPDAMPALLPDNWTGGAILLGMIFLISTFLDNIAAALVGGIIARHVYRGQVNIGFLAAIVTASNAGGAGSVIGDTTTTLMWINGIPPLLVARAFVASTTSLLVVAFIASWFQHRHAPITKHMVRGLKIEWTRGAIVFVILAAAVCANVGATLWCPGWRDRVPFIGLAVWLAILLTSPVRQPDFKVLGPAFHGAMFLLCLVTAASMMPVDRLPVPSWPTALGLGFISAVFNNIPLVALTLKQGGYDWAFLAYSVGVGGSILWFGSSAGVALVGMYPEAGSARNWLRSGWYVPLAYVAGFAVMLAVLGWHPSPPV